MSSGKKGGKFPIKIRIAIILELDLYKSINPHWSHTTGCIQFAILFIFIFEFKNWKMRQKNCIFYLRIRQKHFQRRWSSVVIRHSKRRIYLIHTEVNEWEKLKRTLAYNVRCERAKWYMTTYKCRKAKHERSLCELENVKSAVDATHRDDGIRVGWVFMRRTKMRANNSDRKLNFTRNVCRFSPFLSLLEMHWVLQSNCSDSKIGKYIFSA